MKSILSLILFAGSFSAEAARVSGEAATAKLSSVYSTHVVGQNVNRDVTAKFVVLYSGQSTDFSPLYTLHFNYIDGGEETNITANYPLGQFYAVWEPVRLQAGIYRVKALQALPAAPWIKPVTVTVDSIPAVGVINKLADANGGDQDVSSTTEIDVKIEEATF